MPTLFLFYVGGSAPGANIELHDVQFAVVDQPEDAFPLLKEIWFGDKKQIHVDSYTPIQWADGHDITLSETPATSSQRLWFVNIGGYLPGEPAELHQFGLFVAPTADEAKTQAKKVLLHDTFKQHKDDLRDVDDCLLLQQLNGWHIHLTPNPNGAPAAPLWQGYLPI
ncbi:DUF1543 domain-containing protein [Lonsdalea britannica]|uniref:DUF1543 domain-containing protein n=1 Tax=Lonsdalea britannica TaxID=1082704 RepID=UPI0026F07768|nr:DUF1543 domain-containing protein [Lonsdalea britannica]